ncbi:MAG: tRNA (N6-isopentenyl adenosine(37)-C2)-methylthiotransferase MiaB [Candidatus Syntrophonatronum acetioxidans]|uniref:tRNA-2-methylthio-N(6)-dimethylallyladenosine synthase n=1 Tax=Candidatus Syntrophonatronum acetioxidans TaxID=1795816 RepID=A0A424YDD6_9FIRM|nr:MAG: tRNA (N6-isopentenyl adenosine(37)-C2)-methylthiotransferase MiaB [Candidatus Syntrophonatronum acetioxidans]
MAEVKRKNKFNILTHGCQMNEHDSEILAGFLKGMGYQEIDDCHKADVFIINTCAIREKAEEKVYSRLGALKKLKEERPHMIIGVCGCIPQQEGIARKIKSRYPHVDLVFGTHNLHKFPELLQKAMEKRKTFIDVWPQREGIIEGLPVGRKDGIKAWVPVTYGCNNFCAYCVVPYVRGREHSREMNNIVAEVENLAAEGYKEVTLLGQNVNSYGKDLSNEVSFARLLKRLDKIEDLERIRYMTSHPRDFTGELVEVIWQSSRVCEHFHLPLQSGSNKILKKMNRGYTREDYLELVEYIRELIPQASITTDFIVGFPGEEEKDFADTLDMVEKVRFDSAFTFMYSPRKGTAAAEMPHRLNQEVKKKRLSRLIQLQTRISKEINEKLRGRSLEVLVEGISKQNPSMLTGRTRTNKTVNFKGDKDLLGNLVQVLIKEPKTWSLDGELTREPVSF